MVHDVNRPIGETTKGAIEAKLANMGDYVQMSYLQRALNSNLDFDTRKFCLLRLGGIYEARGMFAESARCIKAAAEINTTYKDKIRDYMKVVELHIKSGSYDEADRMFGQARVLGNTQQKFEMKRMHAFTYQSQGKQLIQNDKRAAAKQLYEHMLRLDLDPALKSEVQQELLMLYHRLGNIREYSQLKNAM